MRRILTIGALGAALLAAACASGPPHGRGGPGPGGRGFDGGEGPGRFGDEDGEGPRGPRQQLFISPSGQPFRAPPGAPYPVAAWFAQADADHDGRLTREEFRADAMAWFKALDVDGDGQIDMPEVTRWEEQVVPEITRMGLGGPGGGFGGRGPRGGGRGERFDTRTQGAAAYSLINEPHPVRGADADFSMSVSRKEWLAAADRRFDLLDVNHDGALELAELPQTPAQRAFERAGERRGPDRDRGSQGRPRRPD